MIPLYLIGGGVSPDAEGLVFGPFLDDARGTQHPRILVAVAGETEVELDLGAARMRDMLTRQGVPLSMAHFVRVSANAPLTLKTLEEVAPSGVLVAGGHTPTYHAALCRDRSWIEWLRAHDIPYAGFSAGAMIATRRCVVGGWRISRGGQVLPIVKEAASEDLDLVEVREGLGLVPFAVDVHASQWGTLARLIHVVEQQAAGPCDGWAIDEDTMIAFDGAHARIHGLGCAYRLIRDRTPAVLVEIHRRGDLVRL